MNEHVYRVSDIGVLVHNQCTNANQTVNARGAVITIRNRELAGKNHPVTGVPFDANGFPNFRRYAYEDVVVTLPNKFKGYDSDFSTADRMAGINKDFRKQHNLTWHHDIDGKTLILVSCELHRRTGHTGGLALLGIE
jgi:hypothetical protein